MTLWQDVPILIIGAARQGVAAARYLAKKGAKVTINDTKSEEEFFELKQQLAQLSIQWEFGGHPLSLLDGKDMLIISGGVPLEIPLIQEAMLKGIPVSNDSQLFMDDVPAPVIGITGSAGKTTTTIFVGEIIKAALPAGQKVWVGGNIGTPLIEQLDNIQASDWVVLELSSFQLDLMTRSPHIAVVLNITPNHLDRHKNIETYTQAKANILRYQSLTDTAVLNHEDSGSMNLELLVKGQIITFGLEKTNRNFPCVYCAEEKITISRKEGDTPVMRIDEIYLRGKHNLLNAMASCAAVSAAGFSPEAMRLGIMNVKGIPHRLEFVREWQQIQWFNDSIATTPERVMASILSFEQPLVLLLGGRDKNLPWGDLVNLIHRRVKHVILFGESVELISNAIGNASGQELPLSITRCPSLFIAVQTAAKIAEPGDVVLLAPGGTSFDEFHDFEDRGHKFCQWVEELT